MNLPLSPLFVLRFRLFVSEHLRLFTFLQLTSPRRGEIVRQIGDALRKHKANLGKLVCISSGVGGLLVLLPDEL